MTVTEDRKDLNGSRNTSHYENETWVEKPWKKFEIVVFRLQKRIYKASREGNFRKVKKLQRLLLKSRSAKFLTVRQVTQLNTGKRTSGIDGKPNLKCFDRIVHNYQMQTIRLPKQYKMGVWKALKADVMIGFNREDTMEGTPPRWSI